MVYVRYDLKNHVLERKSADDFRGETITPLNLDGFFATETDTPESTLYCVTRAGTRIVCIASDDQGESWYDYAISKPFRNPYSVGGLRAVTEDGFIIGSFTDQGVEEDPHSSVHFIKIPVKPPDRARKG